MFNTCKECFSSQHFSKDAPSGPHVNGFGVVIWGKEQTRRTIPFSDQSLRQMPLWKDITNVSVKTKTLGNNTEQKSFKSL